MKIRKAVLPVAGMGTRFFPATKVVPKEMLPIGGKPVIQYLVEEAVASGIEEIIFVISPDKELIRAHFSHQPELEGRLRERGKTEVLEKIQPLHTLARFTYVYQREPLGDGDAILRAEAEVGQEPFLILFGDDVVKSKVPAARQMISHFSGDVLMAVEKVKKSSISSYGVIRPGPKKDRVFQVKGLVEKPSPERAPSHFGIIGKYVCPPSIFKALRESSRSHGGELRLIDGLMRLLKTQKLWAYQLEGERFDTGKPEGLLAANMAFFKKS